MIGNKKSKSADIRSSVVPIFPRFWGVGSRGVVLESAGVVVEEADESMEEVCVVSVCEVLCESFEGDEESEDLENNP